MCSLWHTVLPGTHKSSHLRLADRFSGTVLSLASTLPLIFSIVLAIYISLS